MKDSLKVKTYLATLLSLCLTVIALVFVIVSNEPAEQSDAMSEDSKQAELAEVIPEDSKQTVQVETTTEDSKQAEPTDASPEESDVPAMGEMVIGFLEAIVPDEVTIVDPSGSEPEEAASELPKHTVQILVVCEKNRAFSRYDIDVLVDGEMIGNVEHGGEGFYALGLTEGLHELTLVKEGLREPDGKVSFVVEGEGDKFSYRVSCTKDQIEIDSIDEVSEEQQGLGTGEGPSAIPKHPVQIDVSCKKNRTFSRYDVDVLVDGEMIGNVEHGGQVTLEVSLAEGQHELVFVKEGDSEPKGRATFVVQGEEDEFSYRIGCTKDEINVELVGE